MVWNLENLSFFSYKVSFLEHFLIPLAAISKLWWGREELRQWKTAQEHSLPRQGFPKVIQGSTHSQSNANVHPMCPCTSCLVYEMVLKNTFTW